MKPEFYIHLVSTYCLPRHVASSNQVKNVGIDAAHIRITEIPGRRCGLFPGNEYCLIHTKATSINALPWPIPFCGVEKHDVEGGGFWGAICVYDTIQHY